MARKRNAKKKREQFAKIRQESGRLIDDTCFCNEEYAQELEDRIKAKYKAFAPPRSGEMDFKHFHRCEGICVMRLFFVSDGEGSGGRACSVWLVVVDELLNKMYLLDRLYGCD